ncbi:hypothetical protein IM538_11555 [Cytobacillus suaedae]|nr:hypothetical protein IM538_11555 [Cytobacillus suaedae]
METILNGSIFSGNVDLDSREFVLTSVKEMNTQTVLNEKQLDAIYHYLNKVVHQEEYHVLTLYDQLPVRLKNDEITLLLSELDKIKAMLN